MKLLLCKNVDRLGIVGDIVDVSSGYARNYLVPLGLATEPTQGNMRVLAGARRLAEHDRARQRAEQEALAVRLKDVEITIRARANDAGVLYGSVGKKEIAAALTAEGYYISPDQVVLAHGIGQLDNIEVDIRLAADLRTPVKVWVVREKTDEEGESPEMEPAGAAVKEAKDGDEAAR